LTANIFPEKFRPILLFILTVTMGCSPYHKVQDVKSVMGTYVEIQVWSKKPAFARRAVDDAYEAIEAVNRSMSHYRGDSLISAFNERNSNLFNVSDEDTFDVLMKATEISKLSHGAFDITIGPLMDLWFEKRKEGTLPQPSAITERLHAVGYEQYGLNPETRTIQCRNLHIKLDLSAIAKGFAVDQAVKALRNAGMNRALVNAGGDLFALDPPPGKDAWNIGLRDPFNEKEIMLQIPLTNRAVATSGNYEKFFDVTFSIPAPAIPFKELPVSPSVQTRPWKPTQWPQQFLS